MIAQDGIVLVTGGHGFIGGHVARRLSSEGHDIRIVDINRSSYVDTPAEADVMIGNLCEPAFCARAVYGVKTVLHFAATMGGMGVIHSENDFTIYKENNTMTLNLLSASLDAGVKLFLYASSACVYPESLQANPNEDVSLSETDVWVDFPPHPQGLYGLEKLSTEQILHQFSSKMEIRIARFHNVYGPGGCWDGGREKVSAALLRKVFAAKAAAMFPFDLEIWGDGLQRRSFCYIDDAVDGIFCLLNSDCGEAVNIGSDRAVSVKELAEIAVKCAGLSQNKVSWRYDLSKPVGVASRNSNNDFVRRRLDWSPRITLEEGMQKTGQWISGELNRSLEGLCSAERQKTLQRFQTSKKLDLQYNGLIFAILLPVTSKGSALQEDCLTNLADFARSLVSTTADDVNRLGQRYSFRLYLAIDEDDEFLWRGSGKGSRAEDVLRTEGISHIVTLKCGFPRGHVCALWRHCARQAWTDGCDYFVLMGDDIVLQDTDWMSTVNSAFADLADQEAVPHGFGCIAFTDTTFPGMPTFPVVHRTHMDMFAGEVIPESFVNQDGDPFLFQLYRRWNCSRMIPSRIRNKLGGSEEARYDKVPAIGWTFDPLENATSVVDARLKRRHPNVKRKLTIDVVIPCYRVDMAYLDAFLALRPSPTCTVMFIIIIDNPESPNISDLLYKYAHRSDVRIRVNKVNSGASASRNRGLEESSAEWVHFLDDDVTPNVDLLVECEKAIRRNPGAAGFVGSAQFPSADSIYTAAIHLAGVTYFWNIAEKVEGNMATDIPWGVTANLIARRNVKDGVHFDLRFPKTGGGEDIDFCLKKRQYSKGSGGDGFCAAPNVVVTHPWWNGGWRFYWRFYMWSKGDGGLIKLYRRDYTYRDAAPNAAEQLLCCALIILAGCAASLIGALSLCFAFFGVQMAGAVLFANITHDLYRHLWRDAGRIQDMKTTLAGTPWVLAIIESTFIRIFSELGRTMGLIERGEIGLIGMRFDWFTNRAGKGPRNEEKKNSGQRFILAVTMLALWASVTI